MAAPETPAAPARKRPWALTFFGLLTIAALIAMPILAGPPREESPDWVKFLGHFHPLFLHLPIGVFVLIVLQELGAIFFRTHDPRRAPSLFPMFFGVSTAVLAVVAGFLLYHGHGGDYSGPLVERHLWGGLAFAVAAILTFIVQAWTIAVAGNLAFFRLLLFVSVGLMGLASHDGGSITHGSDFLLRYAPQPIKTFFDAEAEEKRAAPPATKPPEEILVYADIIAPILEAKCVACHKEDKSKGRLRMDTYELMLKGGKEGAALEPGSAEDSNMIYRIELPLDDDEHMPPPEEPQLDPHELLVLKWWIDAGADPEKPLADHDLPSEVRAALDHVMPNLVAARAKEKENVGAGHAPAGPGDELKALVAALGEEFPNALAFESRDSALLTFTAVSMRQSLGDDEVAKLAPVVPHLVSLDLSATGISDAAIAHLAGAENLRLIRLAETAVTDAATETLATLPRLESVNLYGTKVTDEGVLKLAALPNLKRLYLWRTEVSEEAIAALREKLPDCEIVTGI